MEGKEEAPEEGTAMEDDTATKEETGKIIRLGLCTHAGLIGPGIRCCMANKTLESNKQSPLIKACLDLCANTIGAVGKGSVKMQRLKHSSARL